MSKELRVKIEDAVKDGLSNHTGEWFNGWIVPGLSLTEEQSRDLLFYIAKSQRLQDNIAKIISQESNKAVIEELERQYKHYLSKGGHLLLYDDENGNPVYLSERLEALKEQIGEE